MPSKVPAPSKGALRALRSLALGTTCTVVFSTAIIAEDRRRRIRRMQVICENGRKIKAFSRYYGSAPSPAPDPKTSMARYGNLEPDPDDEVPRVFDLQESEDPLLLSEKELELLQRASRRRARPKEKDMSTVGLEEMDGKDADATSQTDMVSAEPPVAVPSTPRAIGNLAPAAPAVSVSGNYANGSTLNEDNANRMRKPSGPRRRVAATIEEGLDVDNIQLVHSAAETFLRTFPRDCKGETFDRSLVDATVRLVKACVDHQLMDTAAEVIKVLCETSQMTEEDFVRYHPEIVLEHITSRSSFRAGESINGHPFQQARAIFCARLEEKPKMPHPRMPAIGECLCEIAFLAEDYVLFDKLYWQNQAWSPGNNVIGIQKLMLAHQKTNSHHKVVKCFYRFAKPTLPAKDYVEAAAIAVESAFLLGDAAKAEAIVHDAAEKSAEKDCRPHVSLLLKVLGGFWRMTLDFTELQALFDRLEKHVDNVLDPIGLYSAMIRLCVQADRLDQVQNYIDRSTSHNCSIRDLTDMQTRCTLALAKATVGDWAGVEDELKFMKELVNTEPRRAQRAMEIQSSNFTPILKLFAESHNVTQTEKFLQRCINEYGILLNQFMSNLMVGAYVKVRELDSVLAWLKYAQSRGLVVNATTFNVLLQGLTRKWGSRRKLIKLVERVKGWNKSVVNEVTLRILGETIIKQNTEAGWKGTRLTPMPKIEREGETQNLPHDSHTVKYAMNCAMAEREFGKALQIYRLARKNRIHLDTSVLDRAIEAVRQIGGYGAADEVADLLADARIHGEDVTHMLPRFMVAQLRSPHLQGPDVDRIIRESHLRLVRRGITLPLQVATESVAILVQRGHFRQAIDLWISLSRQSFYILDLRILNLLLLANVKLYDCHGIRWVVKSLIDGNIRSDSRFRKILKDALKAVSVQIENSSGLVYLEVVQATLVECLRDIHEYSVIAGDRAKKEAEDKVMEIMMLAGAEQTAEKTAGRLDGPSGDAATMTKIRDTGVAD